MTHDRIDELMARRDQLLTEARTEILLVVELSESVTMDRIRQMISEHDATMGEHLREERDALQDRLTEAEQACTELESLHDSDDFNAITTAVGKYTTRPRAQSMLVGDALRAGDSASIQTHVLEVSTAWLQLSDLRDKFIKEARARLLAALERETQPAELLRLITATEDVFGDLLAEEIQMLEQVVEDSNSHAVEVAGAALGLANDAELREVATGLRMIEDALLLVTEHADLVEHANELQDKFEALVVTEHEESASIPNARSEFLGMLLLLQRYDRLEEYLHRANPPAQSFEMVDLLLNFFVRKEALAEMTHDRIDKLMARRDQLLTEACTETLLVVELSESVTMDRIRQMISEHDATMGEHLREERDALQDRLTEAEQACTELESLHDSDDFNAITTAVDKFGGTLIQKKVYNVLAAWSQVSDLRDHMIDNTKTSLQNVMWTTTREMLDLLAEVKVRFGPFLEQYLDKSVSEVWHKIAGRRGELLAEMHEMIGSEHAEILEMEAILHEYEILPQNIPYVTVEEGRWQKIGE